jgi:hypothetical protein
VLVRIADSKGEKRFIAVPIQQIVHPTALFKKPASKSSDLNEADRVLDHVRCRRYLADVPRPCRDWQVPGVERECVGSAAMPHSKRICRSVILGIEYRLT